MVCKTCKNSGVLNQANGKDFYYCRTCKTEIELEVVQQELFPSWASDAFPITFPADPEADGLWGTAPSHTTPEYGEQDVFIFPSELEDRYQQLKLTMSQVDQFLSRRFIREC